MRAAINKKYSVEDLQWSVLTGERSGEPVDLRAKDDNKTRVYDVPRPPFTPRA